MLVLPCFDKTNWSAKLYRVILVFALTVTFNPAGAFDWNSDYGTSLTVGYDDNFRLSTDDEVETSSTEFGLFAGIAGTTEISTINLTLGLNGTTYSESSIDDETSYTLSLATTRTGERLSNSLDVLLESAATTETELLDTGFLDEDGTQDTISVTPGLSYQVDERNSLSASLSLQDVSYDTDSLTDYTENSLSLSWIYQLDETSSVSTSLEHIVYDPDDDDETNTDGVYLGYELRASAATTYNFTVGFTEVERPDDTEDGNNYSFAVNHVTDARNSFTLALSNSYEASGEGDVREEDQLNLGWNHDLSERAQFTLLAEGVSTDDRDFYSLEIGSNYQYTPEMALSAMYRYREEDESSRNADSSAVFFSLIYSSN
jgi:hypothetical protein